MTPSEQSCLEAYQGYIARTYLSGFGVTDPAQVARVAEAWFFADARHDHRFEEMLKRVRGTRFLDLASGMGTATLRGLGLGLDGYGIEPDAEKLSLMRRRIDAGGLPAAWKGRFARAMGEALPYADDAFDCVLSYQTLEHVQDPARVLGEMLRVTRSGGALGIRCPDYRSTWEGHYLLPWLPFFPKPLARAYLRLRGRPVAGLEGIGYVTRPRLERMLRAEAARAGVTVRISDLDRARVSAGLRARKLPGWKGPALPWRLLRHVRRLFQEEIQVNLWVEVEKG